LPKGDKGKLKTVLFKGIADFRQLKPQKSFRPTRAPEQAGAGLCLPAGHPKYLK